MCWTPEVRSTLVETDTYDTSKLVEEAEKRHNAYLAATHPRPSILPTSGITTVRQRPTRPGQPTSPTEPFICWYHLCYGEKAQKFLEGCQYTPNNLSGGRT